MQLNTQELAALADYLLCEIDCSSDYEEDEFSVEWRGHRLYVERYMSHFRVEVDHEDDVIELPRH
ncbi:hypothetical protein [Sphingobium sp. LSP13-1-1.1]|uniref:hypothetical protein n=1 Tax=Sphingobium sp. LSP13-1-1.1 TaxID=3135234 RepID=UPI0034479FCA